MNAPQQLGHTGPTMVVATPVMKRGPVRIAKISNDITLPRPVRLSVLLAGGAGAIIGLVLGLLLGGISGAIYGIMFFGAAGAFVVTWSPLQGESFAKWIELTLTTRRRAHFAIEGQAVRVAVGVCPVPEPVLGGDVHIRAGAVKVPVTQYDERGVRISDKNHNLDRAEWAPQTATADEWTGWSAVAGFDAPAPSGYPADPYAGQPTDPSAGYPTDPYPAPPAGSAYPNDPYIPAVAPTMPRPVVPNDPYTAQDDLTPRYPGQPAPGHAPHPYLPGGVPQRPVDDQDPDRR